jgi:predicted methyltransferase
MRLVEVAQSRIAEVLGPGDIAIDATTGNGMDTAFLARIVGKGGLVYGFDIQQKAICATSELLYTLGLKDRVLLIMDNHADMYQHIQRKHRIQIRAIMFNLGYLPGADQTIVTHPGSTLIALEKACKLLSPGGRIAVLAYTGHPGGQSETSEVRAMANSLPDNYTATVERPANTLKSPPELIVIDRLP